MFTRALFLSVGWMVIAMLAALFGARRLHRGSRWLSILWLVAVLLVGDGWALLTFGLPVEVALLSLIALFGGYWWIRRLPDWSALGQAAWHFIVLSTLLYIAFSFSVTAFTPLHPLTFLIATAVFFIEAAALAVNLTFAYEALDVNCRIRWHRRVRGFQPVPDYLPKVSFHVPAYNEPPEVVEATLRVLARHEYPNYEVLLVDNNTPDVNSWRALESFCHELGPHFRALHLDQWPGYKSGALNFALTQTAPDAQIVAIVDADYQVDPGYLRDLTPAFADSQVAFVQTPQDYRDYRGNSFLEAAHKAYKYFFDVSMPVRNEHNAIIFCGTMGLIRKSALEEVGGWDEWCITEDAEVSVRLLKRGYKSFFINKTYGRGLMPFTFEGLKKQRFRWCFGGVQNLKKHWEALMPWARLVESENRLTPAQRYFFLVGGLQWFTEVFNLIFSIFLLLGAILVLSPLETRVRPFVGPLIIVPATFLVLGMWRFLWALRLVLNLSIREALQAMSSFFSLGWTVTLGAIQGLVQPNGVFMRTPKSRSRHSLVRALRATQWESLIGAVALLLGIGVAVLKPQSSTFVLSALMLWQASLYLAAPANSVLSVRGRPSEKLISRADIARREVLEVRAARWVLGFLLLSLACGVVVHFAPTPAESPRYAQLQPVKIPVERLIGLERVPIEERDLEQPPVLVSPSATPQPSPTNSPSPTPTILPPSATPPATISNAPQLPTGESPTQIPASSQTPIPPQPPTLAPTLPSQVPLPTQTQPPTPTQRPIPTQPPAPTHPVPTQFPTITQVPVPTQAPVPTLPTTRTPPVPTQSPVPTHPAPTQPPVPTHPAPP